MRQKAELISFLSSLISYLEEVSMLCDTVHALALYHNQNKLDNISTGLLFQTNRMKKLSIDLLKKHQ